MSILINSFSMQSRKHAFKIFAGNDPGNVQPLKPCPGIVWECRLAQTKSMPGSTLTGELYRQLHSIAWDCSWALFDLLA